MRIHVLNKMCIVLLFFIFAYNYSSAQDSTARFEEMKSMINEQNVKIQVLENRLHATDSDLKQELSGSAPVFMVLFLFGTVCALWAQSTGRHAISWFFLGLIFSIIAAMTVLYLNGKELSDKN